MLIYVDNLTRQTDICFIELFFQVPYTLTIVDTPGFGDTRGIKQDEKITEQIRTFFNASGVAGIDHIDAICLLAQAGIPRLTKSQLYEFDQILSMFGKDIQKNISVLFTFSDGQKPQALSPLLEAGILDNDGKYFNFNNSALFEENCQCDEENFDQMFWSMGIENFKKFFKSLNGMESKGLVLTKDVLQERERLEMTLSALQDKINCGIKSLSQLQEEKVIFEEHAAAINDNKNFKYTVVEEQRIQVPLPFGTFATMCIACNCICHYPCPISPSKEKKSCAAMTNGRCSICPNRCHWTRHVSDNYRIETKLVTLEKEYDAKKTLYEKALKSQSRSEAFISQLENEFNETQKIVFRLLAEMQTSVQRLSEIALKRSPLQQTDYLDLLIESEEMQGKPGFKDRLRALKETRDRAEQINKMAKPGYDPWKQFRKNEKIQKFFEKQNSWR